MQYFISLNMAMSQDDIFAEWKRNRFVVGENYLTNVPGEFLIVLTDISFWAEHIGKLTLWCQEYNCDHQGMTVTIPDNATLTAFYLKWT